MDKVAKYEELLRQNNIAFERIGTGLSRKTESIEDDSNVTDDDGSEAAPSRATSDITSQVK